MKDEDKINRIERGREGCAIIVFKKRNIYSEFFTGEGGKRGKKKDRRKKKKKKVTKTYVRSINLVAHRKTRGGEESDE